MFPSSMMLSCYILHFVDSWTMGNVIPLVHSTWNDAVCLYRQGRRRSPKKRPLHQSEIDKLIADLRAVHLLPMAPVTEDYIRKVVSEVECITDDGNDTGELESYIASLFFRSLIPPKTNIGTLGQGSASAAEPCDGHNTCHRAANTGPPQ